MVSLYGFEGLGFSSGYFTSAESLVGLLLHSYEVQGSYEGPHGVTRRLGF